ncbi:MAG TPA: CHASE2 domain-containing protein [Luteitalea sp.]|nr:CHASE2 domain-containing protein [Luteitalea sp.]
MRPWSRSHAIVAVLTVAVAVGLDVFGPGRRVDGWLWDRVSRLAASSLVDDRTVVFGIDDASIASLQPVVGAWPYRRDVWAHVVDYLGRAGATHVALDVVLADPREGDEQLRDALARWPIVSLPVVPIAESVSSDRPGTMPSRRRLRVSSDVPARSLRSVFGPRTELQAEAQLAVASVVPDADGVVRRVPLLTHIAGTHLPALSLAPLLRPDASVTVDRTWRGRSIVAGDVRLPVDEAGQTELRYPRQLEADSLPLVDLVRAAITPDAQTVALDARVRGRQVFIGATAVLLEASIETPAGRLPGVEFLRLATVLMRDGAVLRPRTWIPDLTLLAIGLVVLLWVRAAWPEHAWPSGVAVIVGWFTVIAVALALLLVAQHRIWLHGPLVAVAIAGAALEAVDVARLRRERVRLEAERWSAERASELKTQFLNHVAHELRTPVAAILGFGRLIVDRPDADSTREYARVITRNGAHLLQLVNNLLDDATLALGRARVDLRPVLIRQLVRDVLATVEGLPRHEGVVLYADVAPAVPDYLRLDALRIRQVMLNLLGNAMKFTEAGLIHLEVTWQADTLTMSVRDTGLGMSLEVLSRVFDEFELGDPRAVRAGGTGLGLSVSRRLARLLGGELEAMSTAGHGSCFTLTVPALQAEAPETHVVSRPDAIDDTDVSGPLILICDDIEDIRQLFAVVLASAGARIATAETGREAVARTEALAPDAVLLDLDMPDQDGLTTAMELRRGGYEGPIIAISGSGEDREASLRSHGFTDSARKPVSSALLVDLVARHVTHWRPRPAASGLQRTSSSSTSNTSVASGGIDGA